MYNFGWGQTAGVKMYIEYFLMLLCWCCYGLKQGVSNRGVVIFYQSTLAALPVETEIVKN